MLSSIGNVFLYPRRQLNSIDVTSQCMQFLTLGCWLLFAWTLLIKSVLPVLWGGGIWEGSVPNWSMYIDNIKDTSIGNNRSLPDELYTVYPCNSLYRTVCLTFCYTILSWVSFLSCLIVCNSDPQINLLSSRTDAYSVLQLVVLDCFINDQIFYMVNQRLF